MCYTQHVCCRFIVNMCQFIYKVLSVPTACKWHLFLLILVINMTAVCATPRVGIIECQFSTSQLQLFLALHLKGITRAIKFASHKTWTNEKNSLSCLVFRGSNLLVFFSFLFFKLESSFRFFRFKIFHKLCNFLLFYNHGAAEVE